MKGSLILYYDKWTRHGFQGKLVEFRETADGQGASRQIPISITGDAIPAQLEVLLKNRLQAVQNELLLQHKQQMRKDKFDE